MRVGVTSENSVSGSLAQFYDNDLWISCNSIRRTTFPKELVQFGEIFWSKREVTHQYDL